MSTILAKIPDNAGIADVPAVPFGRLVNTELRKLTDTRASRWLLIAIVAITLLVIAITLVVAEPVKLTYDNFVNYTQTPEKILLPVLGILAITSEWSQRTGLVTFTLEPRRDRALTAKITAAVILGLTVVAVTFAAAAIGNILGIVLRDGDGSWSFDAAGFRDIALVQLTCIIQGLAFGALLLSSAAAIVVYYALPNLWGVLFSSVPALKNIAPWVDLTSAQTPLYLHTTTGEAWVQILSSTLIWIVVPLMFGFVRVLRSEIKSS